jgi:hypothetical protein
MFSLSETQRKFIELDKQKAAYKKFIEDYQQAVQDLVKEVGIGAHFQDDQGTVYQTSEADGRWIHFDKYEVNRTRRAGEKSGSLSLTKAKDLGYNVE